MENITFEQFNNVNFKLYANNPVIKNTWNSFVVADPTVLTPEESPDGKWHLFCHTFYGVDHYKSDDGISFKRGKQIVRSAQRPDINCIDGEYYLFFEKTRSAIMKLFSLFGVKWRSEIYYTKSSDLLSWSEPKLALGKSQPFEEDSRGLAISNPFLIKVGEKYRLYYSCGQTFVEDCGFCEPTYINFAESESVEGVYTSRSTPIISPDKSNKFLNLCSGCIKVYKLKDCYIGLQNGIYEDNGKSYSAIMLLRSFDGINFDFVKHLIVPQMCGNSSWMAQYVYACNLVHYNNTLRIYFNARNVANNLIGRECIGFVEAELDAGIK